MLLLLLTAIICYTVYQVVVLFLEHRLEIETIRAGKPAAVEPTEGTE